MGQTDYRLVSGAARRIGFNIRLSRLPKRSNYRHSGGLSGRKMPRKYQKEFDTPVLLSTHRLKLDNMETMQDRAHRFEIRRPVEFRLRPPGTRKEGTGHSLNISKGGILFETESAIANGRKIELTVHVGDAMGGPPVTLHLQGVTIRQENGTVAALIKKHRLRPIEAEA